MYTYIRNISDYKDKLTQAEYALGRNDWRTAFGYYSACLKYAEENKMETEYLKMKVEDCAKLMKA